MRLLLDTHIFLWAISDDPRLSPEAREWIGASHTELLLSVASLWEISIKHSLKPDSMPIGAQAALAWAREAGYSILPVHAEHILCLETLPPLHRDPFDRMLVAQALTEPLRLLTHDAQVAAYSRSLCLLV